MSHSPVLYCVSFPNAAALSTAHGRFNDGDFGYVKSTAIYYTYFEIPPGVPPPGTIFSIEGGAWVPFSGGGPPPPATTAYVEESFTCDPSVAVRDVVYVNTLGVIDRASAATLGATAAVGVVSAKPAGNIATVRYTGALSGFAGLTPGQVYYLGVIPGALLSTPTDAPGYVVQKIGVALDAITLVISVGPNTTVL